ncbi:MAG: high-potential iron-sulfur protein [Woeseiaceae bacterium]
MNKPNTSRRWLQTMTRRRFLTSAGAAAAVATTGFGEFAAANDLARLDEKDPTAKSLNYTHDAKTVDAAKRLSDQYCNNCALFAGDSDDEWAGCGIFPGKAVSGQGWCSVWAAKQTS